MMGCVASADVWLLFQEENGCRSKRSCRVTHPEEILCFENVLLDQHRFRGFSLENVSSHSSEDVYLDMLNSVTNVV